MKPKTLCNVFMKEEMVRRGKVLRHIREGLKMTQKDAARQLGISRSALANWERGRGQPSVALWLRIAYLYKVSTDFLLNAKATVCFTMPGKKP